jgi:predicted Zn-dependent protease
LVEGEASGNGLLIGYDLMLANALSLVANLWPRRFSSVRGRIANDGMRLATIIRSLSDPEEAEKRHWLGIAAREQGRGNDAGVRDAFEKLIEVDRTDPHARLGMAGALMMTGEHQWARALFLELLAMRNLTSEDRASIENQLAFNNLLSGDDGLLEEADRCSANAMAADPYDPHFKGTRGGVLVMLDRVDEALPLLEEAFCENVRPQDRAVDLTLMAAAYRRQGKVSEAKECEREAGRDYVLVGRLGEMLEIQNSKLSIQN